MYIKWLDGLRGQVRPHIASNFHFGGLFRPRRPSMTSEVRYDQGCIISGYDLRIKLSKCIPVSLWPLNVIISTLFPSRPIVTHCKNATLFFHILLFPSRTLTSAVAVSRTIWRPSSWASSSSSSSAIFRGCCSTSTNLSRSGNTMLKRSNTSRALAGEQKF